MIKDCIVCNTKFETNHPNYLTCSYKCNKINKVIKRYARTNNDWHAYFRHLLSKKSNSDLTIEGLIKLLIRQQGRCALSGEDLTCIHKRGKVIQTNASIDRINAGGEYNMANIQLVCRALNSFRGASQLNDFINWCKKVANKWHTQNPQDPTRGNGN
jgi:predicted nucleic acid-binding Zn ribbon protein